jgi:hypothetical protein
MIGLERQATDLQAYRRMIKMGRSEKAVRKRILLIAQERGLPKAIVSRALKASVKRGHHLIDFAGAHNINLNWLFFGDIRGLARQKIEP